MKKTKLIMPLIGTIAMGATIAPILSLSSCAKSEGKIVVDGEKTQECNEYGLLIYSFKLNEKTKDNRVHVVLNSNSNATEIKLDEDIVSVNSETNEFYVPLSIYGATQEGQIKFGLTFVYSNEKGNSVTTTIDGFVAKYKSLDVKPIALAVSSQPYALNDEKVQCNVEFYPDNTKNKNVVWTYSVPQGSSVFCSEFNKYAGTFTFTGRGEVVVTATSLEDHDVYNSTTLYVCSAQDYSEYLFCNDSWENLCKYADQGIDKLVQYYGFNSATDMIGLTRYIKIGKIDYKVRVIDVDHDTIASSTNKAALTFQLENIVSNLAGPRFTLWDDATPMKPQPNNCNYVESLLNEVLTKGSEQHILLENSCLDDLIESNPELAKSLKTVTKSVATSTDTQNYTLTPYNTKLFVPSICEMLGTGGTAMGVLEEGTKYRYFNQITNYKKTDIWGHPTAYWLVSPYVSGDTRLVCAIAESGTPVTHRINISTAISYCFCI